jgi:hypothetical protein
MPTDLPPEDFRRRLALLRRLPAITAVLAVVVVVLAAMLVRRYLL